MNAEVMQSRWAQLRSEAQQRWNRLTDEDLTSTRGQVEGLVDVVGKRYGVTRQTAQEQVDRFMRQYDSSVESLQQAAKSGWEGTRKFAADNPWAGIILAVLLLGLIVGVFVRPNMRNY